MSSSGSTPGGASGSQPGQAPASIPGPPYLPQTASLGGQPVPNVDDPIVAVLLIFFIGSAVLNMTILQRNNRRGHKFLFSGLMFGFSMARITALVMRIVWASRPRNINIAIAANIFTVAGVILLFVVNLFFMQRIVRAQHPNFGWHRSATILFRFAVFCVPASLVMVVTATVLSFFTLDQERRRMCRDVQLVTGTLFAFLAFLPIPVLLVSTLTAGGFNAKPRDNFGAGTFRTKIFLVLFTASLLTFGAGFRCGVSYDVRPITQPAWFHHKAAYYCVNYVIELIVVYTYVATRVDRRHHIPNGAKGPGSYSSGSTVMGIDGDAEKAQGHHGHGGGVFGHGTVADNTSSTLARMTNEWEEDARQELKSDGEATNL